jgi:hypothetical protein
MKYFFAIIMTVLSFNSTVNAEGLVFNFPHSPYVTVTGNGNDVALFVERYQDILWPDWRDDDKYAREMITNLRNIRRTGKATVYYGDDKSQRAVELASLVIN